MRHWSRGITIPLILFCRPIQSPLLSFCIFFTLFLLGGDIFSKDFQPFSDPVEAQAKDYCCSANHRVLIHPARIHQDLPWWQENPRCWSDFFTFSVDRSILLYLSPALSLHRSVGRTLCSYVSEKHCGHTLTDRDWHAESVFASICLHNLQPSLSSPGIVATNSIWLPGTECV